jgi:Ca-activated chloride channel homolog
MDIQVGNPNWLWLLIVIAAGLVATFYGATARRRAARQFSSTALRGKLIYGRHGISAILLAASLLLITIGLLDIRWGKTWRDVPQKGIEVMFVLDVSRSMLAEDVSPNRLTRAKQQIKDLLDEMAGDRVGLIVFAGEARQMVPLTSHHEDFKQTLDAVGPHSLRRGGSRLGEAITAAANSFISKTNDHKTIVIFTDGEDQESRPVEVAKKLHAEQGIRLFTVGLGDMEQGARIPDEESRRGGYVVHEGEQVWSKMNGQILQQIAQVTSGAYIPAGTKQVNMADVYHRFLANIEQQDFETARITAYIPRFQWFAAPALVLLLAETWLATRRRTNCPQTPSGYAAAGPRGSGPPNGKGIGNHPGQQAA